MKKEGNTFSKRYEKKFFLSQSLFKSLVVANKKPLAAKFERDHFSEKTKFTDIKNIYFDTYNLDSYQDHMNKKPERHKLRLRSYSQDGIPNDLVFIEIKSKIDGATFKSRLALKKSWVNDLLKSKELPKDKVIELNSSNKSLSEIIETYDRIVYFISYKKYRPIMKTDYRRYAYRMKDSGDLRITLDTDLKFERIGDSILPEVSYQEKFSQHNMIVELKYKNKEVLEMIPEIMDTLGAPAKFSKYCYGVSSSTSTNLTDKIFGPFNLYTGTLLGSFNKHQDYRLTRITA